MTPSFNLQPRLSDEALLLRPMHPDDWPSLLAVASDPLIWAGHPASDRWQEPVFGRYFAEALDSGGALVAIECETDKIIGASRYDHARVLPGEVEIGWTFLSRSHWGGSWNLRMKRLMVGHALTGVARAIFVIAERNIRSQRAMEKIGGVLTDRVMDLPMADSVIRHVVYAIDRAAYDAGPLIFDPSDGRT